MASKYDKLLPEILEDLKVMSQREVEKKHNLRYNFLSHMIIIWKQRGLIPKDYVVPARFRRGLPITPYVPPRAATVNLNVSNSTSDKVTILKVASETIPVEKVRLPPFDNSWSNEVKEKWLEAYIAVVGRAKTIPFKEETEHSK
jgi:hypothetical protein